ncbi:nucleotide-diphospho-sugar transferase [Runella salmonicolor]|uniref:Nucleotide-diphospho-sugar transferase n=1 Tax=Runella salmonicolor TaxID=2950278 RepID=A0ABT1FRH9_9BACT|nr:nucleotide-diphospho-sugar transferase [Runella salmonicolor]MCP1384369.1 nucleotide-diphospho-sugar transferase [Runella salmonicolor]
MSPILFLIFNRPKQTKLVFEQIRKAKPRKLFIAADGPRSKIKGEIELCNEARSITNLIDWDCEVNTLFRPTNLGCGKAVSEAIDWFFENVKEGIILEDDCLPDQTFFSFCTELLDYYRDDERVAHIAGSNHQLGNWRGEGSYYFSNFVHIWGWATWKRAWNYYDFTCKNFQSKGLQKMEPMMQIALKKTLSGELDTWDLQWNYAVVNNNKLSIIPNISLIKNIGYDSLYSTHTKKEPKWIKKMKYGKIETIIHPNEVSINVEADIYSRKIFGWNKFKAILLSLYFFYKKIFK